MRYIILGEPLADIFEIESAMHLMEDSSLVHSLCDLRFFVSSDSSVILVFLCIS